VRPARLFPFGHDAAQPREARPARLVPERVTDPLVGFVPPERVLPFSAPAQPAPAARAPQRPRPRARLWLALALALFVFDVAALWLVVAHGGR